MFVLVQNGQAHQIWETRPELHSDLMIVETDGPVEVGWAWQDEHFAPQAAKMLELAVVKATAIVAVDQHAELARAKFVTQGSAQAMVYLAKEAEARSCLEDAHPSPADYPLLSAEIGITGKNLQEVASTVMASASAWHVIAAQIEKLRLLAKKMVQESATVAAVDAVFAGLKYPEP
jgi:hypothetical protein